MTSASAPPTAATTPAATLAAFRDAHRGQTILVCGCGESLNLLEHPERFVTIGVNDVGAPLHEELSLRRRLPRRPNGCARIGLLGVDFTEHHFFGNTGVHQLARSLVQIDREYARLAAACRARGIEMVNLSPRSRLTALPRMTLEEFAAPRAPVTDARAPAPGRRRVFFVNYRFLACGDMFATGLAHAADALGVEHRAAWWDDPALPAKVRAFEPDLVFVLHGRRAARRWGRRLRERKTAVWLVDEPYEVDDTSRWSSSFGRVFVNDPATVARHRNAHPLPVCFDFLCCAGPRRSIAPPSMTGPQCGRSSSDSR